MSDYDLRDLHEWLARRAMSHGCLKNEDADYEATAIIKHLKESGLIQVSTLTGKGTADGGTTMRMPSTPQEVRAVLEACAERERVMREALIKVGNWPSHIPDDVRWIAIEALEAVDRKEVKP